jgi:GNAT superfamily N-acetyltransferase
MDQGSAIRIRPASLPADLPAIERLWLEYLVWGNKEMQARHGIHPHDPQLAVAEDIASIRKFQPPAGQIFLLMNEDRAAGIGCLRRLSADIAEIKRMYVEPELRGLGAGRALLERLIAAASEGGYSRVRLDSLDLMTAAHALYRRCGFVDIPPYPESEIAEVFRPHMVFMERQLLPRHP